MVVAISSPPPASSAAQDDTSKEPEPTTEHLAVLSRVFRLAGFRCVTCPGHSMHPGHFLHTSHPGARLMHRVPTWLFPCTQAVAGLGCPARTDTRPTSDLLSQTTLLFPACKPPRLGQCAGCCCSTWRACFPHAHSFSHAKVSTRACCTQAQRATMQQAHFCHPLTGQPLCYLCPDCVHMQGKTV